MKLTREQADTLKEVGNVGAGRASNALAKMLNKNVLVDITQVRLVSVDDVSSLVGGPTVPAVCVLFGISGESPGYLMMLNSEKTSVALLERLQGKEEGSLNVLGEMDKDTLKEIGNILAGAYLSALSDFTKLNLIESLPKLILNNVDGILKGILEKYNHDVKHVVAIDNKLKIEGEKFEEELVMLFKPGSFENVFEALEKRLKKK